MAEIQSLGKWPLSEAELSQVAVEMHAQSVKRQQMKRALRSVMTPALRRAGFTGTCPRYRRLTSERYDLLMFDFNRYADFFSIQIGQCAPDDYGSVPREKIDPEYLRFEQRARIQPGPGIEHDDLFQYGHAKAEDDYRQIALSALPYVEKAIAHSDDFGHPFRK